MSDKQYRLDDLLAKLWEGYRRITPQAQAIHRLLEAQGERIFNDHLAMRTFQHERVGLGVLAQPLVDLGYRAADEYSFPEKKLHARHFEPPDAQWPKVFISELVLSEFSDRLRGHVAALVEQVSDRDLDRWDLPAAGRLWTLPTRVYDELAEESEYAAWVAAFGFCANHFTVSVNDLTTFQSLTELNEFLKANGFVLNRSGGEIKGSPQVFLEQSSTVADRVKVAFQDAEREVPGCYYEFARRYRLPNGSTFQGFIARNADKLFESTDRRIA